MSKFNNTNLEDLDIASFGAILEEIDEGFEEEILTDTELKELKTIFNLRNEE